MSFKKRRSRTLLATQKAKISTTRTIPTISSEKSRGGKSERRRTNYSSLFQKGERIETRQDYGDRDSDQVLQTSACRKGQWERPHNRGHLLRHYPGGNSRGEKSQGDDSGSEKTARDRSARERMGKCRKKRQISIIFKTESLGKTLCHHDPNGLGGTKAVSS